MENSNMSDHDLLITLVTTVNEQHKGVIEKIEDLRKNIKDIKDVELKELKNGTHQRITALELRVNAIEKLHDEVNPKDSMNQLKRNTEWINNFKVSWKAIVFIIGVTSSVVTFILTLLLQLSSLVKLASG